ncbi:hypothetical protein BC835DRAFT_1350818 [Cytidiella melzeri]|nr:hypothetical protein BC835DRAFT_1350818 [Cytidiella melzeri]
MEPPPPPRLLTPPLQISPPVLAMVLLIYPLVLSILALVPSLFDNGNRTLDTDPSYHRDPPSFAENIAVSSSFLSKLAQLMRTGSVDGIGIGAFLNDFVHGVQDVEDPVGTVRAFVGISASVMLVAYYASFPAFRQFTKAHKIVTPKEHKPAGLVVDSADKILHGLTKVSGVYYCIRGAILDDPGDATVASLTL